MSEEGSNFPLTFADNPGWMTGKLEVIQARSRLRGNMEHPCVPGGGRRCRQALVQRFSLNRRFEGMITSFIIRYLGWQAGIRVAWPRQRLSREMRPLAFLDPSAFMGSNPDNHA